MSVSIKLATISLITAVVMPITAYAQNDPIDVPEPEKSSYQVYLPVISHAARVSIQSNAGYDYDESGVEFPPFVQEWMEKESANPNTLSGQVYMTLGNMDLNWCAFPIPGFAYEDETCLVEFDWFNKRVRGMQVDMMGDMDILYCNSPDLGCLMDKAEVRFYHTYGWDWSSPKNDIFERVSEDMYEGNMAFSVETKEFGLVKILWCAPYDYNDHCVRVLRQSLGIRPDGERVMWMGGVRLSWHPDVQVFPANLDDGGFSSFEKMMEDAAKMIKEISKK